jgi:hypothetical protein
VRIFVDDRFDMYPLSVSRDYEVLLSARAATFDVLDRYDIDVVLWQKKLPLVQVLKASGWRETFSEDDYVILER